MIQPPLDTLACTSTRLVLGGDITGPEWAPLVGTPRHPGHSLGPGRASPGDGWGGSRRTDGNRSSLGSNISEASPPRGCIRGSGTGTSPHGYVRGGGASPSPVLYEGSVTPRSGADVLASGGDTMTGCGTGHMVQIAAHVLLGISALEGPGYVYKPLFNNATQHLVS